MIGLTVSCDLDAQRDMLFFRSFTRMRFRDWARHWYSVFGEDIHGCRLESMETYIHAR